MRPRVAAPPEPDEVAERAIHALIRDYPEALGALDAIGVDARESGGRSPGELGLEAAVRRALATRLSWREQAHEKGATRPGGSPLPATGP